MAGDPVPRSENGGLPELIGEVDICRLILEAGAVDIRDVDGGG